MTPLPEVVAAVKELTAFSRMYIDCLQLMAVRGHIERPPEAEILAWRRRIALADEAAAALMVQIPPTSP